MKRTIGILLIISLLILAHPIQAQDDPPPITLEMRLGNGIVTSVAWSPDGSTLAVDGPGGVWLYNTADFAAPPRLLEGQGGTQQTIAFSPDGRTLASASNQWEKQVWLWDVASGELQGVIQTPDNSPVLSLAWSPDGKTLATGEGHQGFKVRLWDVATLENIETLDRHTAPVTSLVFTPDGTGLISGSEDGTIQGWDDDAVRKLTRVGGRLQAVNSLSLHPTQNILAIGTRDTSVRFWDAGQQGAGVLNGNQGAITSVAFSPNGEVLASAGNETVQLWNVPQLQGLIAQGATLGPDEAWVVDEVVLEGHDATVIQVAFSPDSTRLASASDDGTVRIWDVATRETLAVLGGPTGEITDLTFNSDSTVLAAGYYNRNDNSGMIQIWDITTGQLRLVLDIPWPNKLTFRPNSTQVAAISNNRGIILLDTASGQRLKTLQVDTHFGLMCLSFSPDGRGLVTGYADGMVRLWDVDAGAVVREFGGNTGGIDDMAFSPDGRTIAAISFRDDLLQLWDVETALLVASVQDDRADRLAYRPDGTALLTVGYDRQFWDMTTADRVPVIKGLTFANEGHINDAAYSPDGSLIAAVDLQGKLYILNADGEIRATLQSGQVNLSSTAFSPDGTLIATGGNDGVIRLWSMSSETAQLLAATASAEPGTCIVTLTNPPRIYTYTGPYGEPLEEAVSGTLVLDGQFTDDYGHT